MSDSINILNGSQVDRFDERGRLIDLTDKELAAAAFKDQRLGWMCPVKQWVKDFPGQTTDGRIGRPTHLYAPVSWLGDKRAQAVVKLAEAKL